MLLNITSAWKKLFFIDCFGSRVTRNCRRREARTNGDSSSPSSRSSSLAGMRRTTTTGKQRTGKIHGSGTETGATRIRTRTRTRSGVGAGAGIGIRIGTGTGTGNESEKSSSKLTVRSPSNKALLRTDPLFHLYLICVGLITLSILAIKVLVPGMRIYVHAMIGFAFLLAIIAISNVYTLAVSKKIRMQFRVLLWLIISASLTMSQLLDFIVPDESNIASNPDFLKCAFAWYYTFTIIVAMTATSIFIRINVWLKFSIHLITIISYILINSPPASMLETLKKFLRTPGLNWSILDHKQEFSHLFYIIMIAIILHLIDRQVEYILSLNIQWNEQLERDRVESQTVGQINRILLENILPPHVLKRYLYNAAVSYDQLYHESHQSCAVMFASIPNYESFYTENNLNEQGLKCLQLLNEIICDFDQLLSHPSFRGIEKIKTIGSTYMAACFDISRRASDCTSETLDSPNSKWHSLEASNLKPPSWSNTSILTNVCSCPTPNSCSCPTTNRPQNRAGSVNIGPDEASQQQSEFESAEANNVVTMVCFATALMEELARINRDAFQEFRLRIGIATGPVIAGVVGATKPTYDIWGDTVNVASRLESSGIAGRIQVTERVAQILNGLNQFELECRGPIEVKGKGILTTYLVVTPFDSSNTEVNGANKSGDQIVSSSDDRDELEAQLACPPPALEDQEDEQVEELCNSKDTIG